MSPSAFPASVCRFCPRLTSACRSSCPVSVQPGPSWAQLLSSSSVLVCLSCVCLSSSAFVACAVVGCPRLFVVVSFPSSLVYPRLSVRVCLSSSLVCARLSVLVDTGCLCCSVYAILVCCRLSVLVCPRLSSSLDVVHVATRAFIVLQLFKLTVIVSLCVSVYVLV